MITTVPNVSYNVYDKHNTLIEVHNPAGMPDAMEVDHIEEPYIRASIITRTDYIGNIMSLCLGKARRTDQTGIMCQATAWNCTTTCRWPKS